MKVWEALQILESLDKTLDVTLIFGGTVAMPKSVEPAPAYRQPTWTSADPYSPPFTVTCKTVQ